MSTAAMVGKRRSSLARSAVCEKFVAAGDVSPDGLRRFDMERGSAGFGGRGGQIVAEESRGGLWTGPDKARKKVKIRKIAL
jgi:hypothetical protein